LNPAANIRSLSPFMANEVTAKNGTFLNFSIFFNSIQISIPFFLGNYHI